MSATALNFEIPTKEQVRELFTDFSSIAEMSNQVVEIATSQGGLYVGVADVSNDNNMSWPPEVFFTPDSASAQGKAHARAMTLAVTEGRAVVGEVLEDEAAAQTAGNFFAAVLEACEADFPERDIETLEQDIKTLKGNITLLNSEG